MSEETKSVEVPKKKKKIKIHSVETQSQVSMAVDDITNQLKDSLVPVLQKSIEGIKKDPALDGKYNKSKVSFNGVALGGRTSASGNTEDKAWRRLSDQEMRDLSLIDPYIGAIITTRCSQSASCGRPSESKFDKGFRVSQFSSLKREDFQSEEDYKKESAVRSDEMAAIMKWVLNCGTGDKKVLDYVFYGQDMMFKKCSFKSFIESQVRNLLTFGRMATQVFRNRDGLPVFWRPVPVETIRPAIQHKNLYLGQNEDTYGDSLKDLEEYNKLKEEERPPAWIQQINGQDVNFFTEEDLKVSLYQTQALYDLRGYPLAPMEQAIYLVFVHQQTLTYLRNQFVKGIAAKGILTIKSTDPQVELSPADLEEFKQEFANFVARNDNNATCPVLADVEVGFVSLNPTPKDMEFLNLEEHVIRGLCSAFQISPQEMGFGNLNQNVGGASQVNKQDEIIHGEERGLRNLLDVVFEMINDLLYENFPEAEDKYYVSYVGIGEDTRDVVIQRGLSELQTTATLSSLYADSEKTEDVKIGGEVPLAAAYHESVLRYCKYGEVMEKLFGEKGASQNPDYDFIIDPQLNQAYMQNKMMAAQAQGAGQPGQAPGQPGQPGAPGQEAPPGTEPEQKSENITLEQKYLQSLQKSEQSIVSLFDSWCKVQ